MHEKYILSGISQKTFEISHKISYPFIEKKISVMQSFTHWGRDQMATISQTTFLNAFLLIKMHEFRSRFHWSSFLRFKLTIF